MPDFVKMSRDERIKHRRNKLKLSPSYIAKYVGVSRVAYVYWEDGTVSDIAWSKYLRLADVLLTTPHWLEYGTDYESYICNNASGDITKNLNGIHVIKSNSIPVLGSIEDSIDLKANKSTEFIDIPAKNSDIFALRVNKEKSLYQAHKGDAVIIDPQAEKFPGENVYINFKDSTAIICIFNYEKDDELNCTSETGRESFSIDEINFAFPIVGVAMNSYIRKGSK